jgi:hypothetical protein
VRGGAPLKTIQDDECPPEYFTDIFKVRLRVRVKVQVRVSVEVRVRVNPAINPSPIPHPNPKQDFGKDRNVIIFHRIKDFQVVSLGHPPQP